MISGLPAQPIFYKSPWIGDVYEVSDAAVFLEPPATRIRQPNPANGIAGPIALIDSPINAIS